MEPATQTALTLEQPLLAALPERDPGVPLPAAWRCGLLGLLGLAWFVVLASLLRGLLPYPPDFLLGPKLEHLAEQPDRYDLAYIGSSTTFRHFVPRVFDERMAELGYPVRSLNLGTPAMGSFELDAGLRQLAAVEGLDLDFILVEPSAPNLEMPGFRSPTARQVHYHDPVELMRALEAGLADENLDAGELWVAMQQRLRCALWRLGNFGQGKRMVEGLRGRAPMDAELDWIVAEAGYRALEDDPDPLVALRGERFREDPSDLDATVKRLRSRYNNANWAEPDWRYHARQVELVEGLGAVPVRVLSASAVARMDLWRLGEEPGQPLQLVYNRPDAFPRLYRPQARFDKNHLGRAAAAWLSRRLAEDLVEGLGPELEAWKAAQGAR